MACRLLEKIKGYPIGSIPKMLYMEFLDTKRIMHVARRALHVRF